MFLESSSGSLLLTTFSLVAAFLYRRPTALALCAILGIREIIDAPFSFNDAIATEERAHEPLTTPVSRNEENQWH